MSLVAKYRLKVNMADVVKAFTIAKLDEIVYVEQPHGFVESGKVCRLNQALEGTKQAGHLWQQLLIKVLLELGMTQSTTDPCLFYKRDGQDSLYLVVWVDDMLCASSSQKVFDDFFELFKAKINSTRDDSSTFIGIKVIIDDKSGKVSLSQEAYIEKLYQRFMSEPNTKAWKTPTGTSRDEATKFMSISTASSDEERLEMSTKGYLSLMGGLLYASCMTRPDVAFHVNFLCQFMKDPSREAYNAGLGVLAYLYETRAISLTYGGEPRNIGPPEINSSDGVVAFADSSFGQSPFPYGGGFVWYANAAVSWLSRKVRFVPLSTCEAETAAMTDLAKEEIYVNNILQDLGYILPTPLIISDSKSAVDIVKNPGTTKRSIHFDRWLHFTRELYLKKKIRVELAGTYYMMADDKTKVVDRDKFFRCRAFQMNI